MIDESVCKELWDRVEMFPALWRTCDLSGNKNRRFSLIQSFDEAASAASHLSPSRFIQSGSCSELQKDHLDKLQGLTGYICNCGWKEGKIRTERNIQLWIDEDPSLYSPVQKEKRPYGFNKERFQDLWGLKLWESWSGRTWGGILTPFSRGKGFVQPLL